MVVNDPIADMLTRIRNAQIAKHDAVVRARVATRRRPIAKILLDEGYHQVAWILSMTALQGSIKIALKYVSGKQQARHHGS